MRLALVLAVGCGRIDFDVRNDATAIDAAPAITLQNDSAQNYPGCTTDPAISLTSVTQGALVIACTATDLGTVTSVTDSQGNTYTPLFAASESSCGITVYCYDAVNINANGPLDLVIHGGILCAATARAYTGVATLAATSTGFGTGALGDSGPVTVAGPDVLYFAAQTHCMPLVTTPGPGWGHHLVADEVQSNSQALSIEDIIGGGATADGQFVFTPAETNGWVVGVAAFTP